LRALVEADHPPWRGRRPGALLGRCRARLDDAPVGETLATVRRRRLRAAASPAPPFRGSRRMTVWRRGPGEPVHRKRGPRLLRRMGLEAISPKPQRRAPGGRHRMYPSVRRGVQGERPDQVGRTDSPSVPLAPGFRDWAARLDWDSRSVRAGRLSNPRDGSCCRDLLDEAWRRGRPEGVNTNQGAPCTAQAWTGRLAAAGVAVRRAGTGRCRDNVFGERWGRTVKEEDIDLRGQEDVPELHEGCERYFRLDNDERPQQALA
jgi:putative transposase